MVDSKSLKGDSGKRSGRDVDPKDGPTGLLLPSRLHSLVLPPPNNAIIL